METRRFSIGVVIGLLVFLTFLLVIWPIRESAAASGGRTASMCSPTEALRKVSSDPTSLAASCRFLSTARQCLAGRS